MNAVVTLILAAIAVVATFLAQSPDALRRLAAWALSRAIFIENLREETKRLQEQRDEFHERRLVEFGVSRRAE